MVDGLRDVIGSVFEFSSLLEQQRTVSPASSPPWAAILAVPDCRRRHLRRISPHAPSWTASGAIRRAADRHRLHGLYIRFKRTRGSRPSAPSISP
jgi:hypothetical protein